MRALLPYCITYLFSKQVVVGDFSPTTVIRSVAGGSFPTASSSHCHWCGNYCCNCLFTTLVTRVGYLLLLYSVSVDAIQPRISERLGRICACPVTFCPALSESTSGVNPKPVLYRTLFYAGTSLLNTACPYHAANRFEWSRGDSNPCVVHVSIQYQQYQRLFIRLYLYPSHVPFANLYANR